MHRQKYIRTFIMTLVFVLGFQVHAFGIKIPKLSKDSEEQTTEPATEEAASIDFDAIDTSSMSGEEIASSLKSAQGDDLLPAVDLLKNVVGASRRNFLLANKDLARALGLKEDAENFEAQAEVLATNSVTTKHLKSTYAETEESIAAVSEALGKKEPLSEESKELYASGVATMKKAIFQEALLIGATGYLGYETVQQGEKLKKEAEKAGMIDKAKLLRRAGEFGAAAAGTVYLAKQIPGDVKAGMKTYKLAREFGKENGIEIEELDEKKMDMLLAEAEDEGEDTQEVLPEGS
jgi:hypothetical protein